MEYGWNMRAVDSGCFDAFVQFDVPCLTRVLPDLLSDFRGKAWEVDEC
jgi:hypothetical protein